MPGSAEKNKLTKCDKSESAGGGRSFCMALSGGDDKTYKFSVNILLKLK